MEPSHKLETLLGLTLLGLVLLLLLTGILARAYRDKREALGQDWYARGQSELNQGKTAKAIVDFRTALVYTRESGTAELSLAQALMAARHYQEARGYLAGLWDREPGNAQVNLELGRLAAIESNESEALRYYHNALYDDWGSEDPARARRVVRLELYQFLMRKGDRRQAQAELVSMVALLPPDPGLYTQAGQLFFEVDDPGHAATYFRDAIQFGAGEAAEEGLGEAEYLQGHYREAALPLERALREKPGDPRLTAMLDQDKVILEVYPFDPGLTPEQRAQRAARAFSQALDRLSACGLQINSSGQSTAAPTTATARPLPPTAKATLDSLAERSDAMRSQLRQSTLRDNLNLQKEAADLTFRIEQAAAEVCPPPTAVDRALILLARQHAGSDQ